MNIHSKLISQQALITVRHLIYIHTWSMSPTNRVLWSVKQGHISPPATTVKPLNDLEVDVLEAQEISVRIQSYIKLHHSLLHVELCSWRLIRIQSQMNYILHHEDGQVCCLHGKTWHQDVLWEESKLVKAVWCSVMFCCQQQRQVPVPCLTCDDNLNLKICVYQISS